jgi:hypothetical protein
MRKYTVNVMFTDKNTWETFKKGSIVELEEDRFTEIVKILGENALTKVEEEPVEEEPVKKSGRGKNKETEEVE